MKNRLIVQFIWYFNGILNKMKRRTINKNLKVK